jgi:phosphoribosylformimino-5-aminoimidazole carboxamide ribotide isomerase
MLMKTFDVYPAIDLRAGSVVRLVQGDPQRQTTYDANPAGTARRWMAAGAHWLHVINLDGALEEADQANWVALQEILRAAKQNLQPVKVQFGGGLRKLSIIEGAIACGVTRVILGTVAVQSPEVVSEAVRRFGEEAIAVALDFADEKVKLRGWLHESDLDPITLGKRLAELGVHTLIVTDITRDGVGVGVNVGIAQETARSSGLSVIASGGVASLKDVRQVRAAGIDGVIIGKALYQGTIDLKEALKC